MFHIAVVPPQQQHGATRSDWVRGLETWQWKGS